MTTRLLSTQRIVNIADDPATGTSGELYYNTTKNVLRYYDGTNWTDFFATQVKHLVKNDSGITLNKGTVVYTSGANGSNILVKPAQANSDSLSAQTMGFLESTLAPNDIGYAVVNGFVNGLDTSSASAGAVVWLSPTTPGGVIYGLENKPKAPDHLVYLGVVTRSNINNGEIFVHISNGWEIGELHDVRITNPQNNDILVYNSASSIWTNSIQTGVTSIAGTINEIDVSASAGSVIVSLPSSINADITGNAATATSLSNSRIIQLSGNVSGSASFNGTSDITINTSITPETISLDQLSDVSTSSAQFNDLLISKGSWGITWNTQNSTFGNTGIMSTVYGNSLWVAVGYYGQLRTSTNAISWATQTSNFGTTDIISVNYGNGLWVAGGNDGGIRTSTNTITWTTRSSSGLGRVTTIAYGNGTWAAADWNGQLRTSTDTVTWTTRISSFGNTGITSIAYDNELWVAVGYSAQMRTSTNAITWVTRQPSFEFQNINDVAYGNNLWIAVGRTGRITTSTDAITWITRTSNFISTQRIQSVAYGNELWVAAGYNGQLRQSTDGITWITRSPSFGSSNIYSLSYGNNLFVAAGYGMSTLPFTSEWRSGSQTITLSGDISGSGTTSISATLANTAVSAASYGSASAVGAFTVDSKGRLTAASNTTILIPQSSVTNLTNDLSGKAPLASPTFTGTVTVPTPVNSTDAATKGYVDSVVINTQTASYILALADAGEVVEMNVGTANNLTVPASGTVNFPIGTSIDIIQYGSGQTTIVAAVGVTLRSSGGKLKLTGQYSGATLYKRGTDEWVVIGDLSS